MSGRLWLQCGWSVHNRSEHWQEKPVELCVYGGCVSRGGWKGESAAYYGRLYQNMSLLRNGWLSTSKLFPVKYMLFILSSLFYCATADKQSLLPPQIVEIFTRGTGFSIWRVLKSGAQLRVRPWWDWSRADVWGGLLGIRVTRCKEPSFDRRLMICTSPRFTGRNDWSAAFWDSECSCKVHKAHLWSVSAANISNALRSRRLTLLVNASYLMCQIFCDTESSERPAKSEPTFAGCHTWTTPIAASSFSQDTDWFSSCVFVCSICEITWSNYHANPAASQCN